MEPTEPAEPIASEVTPEQRLQRRRDHLAQFRALSDERAELAQQLHDLHARYLVLEGDPAVSAEERQAQTEEIVRAESEALQQIQHVLSVLQHLLQEHH